MKNIDLAFQAMLDDLGDRFAAELDDLMASYVRRQWGEGWRCRCVVEVKPIVYFDGEKFAGEVRP